jgi:hypothetical protein
VDETARRARALRRMHAGSRRGLCTLTMRPGALLLLVLVSAAVLSTAPASGAAGTVPRTGWRSG